MTLIYLTGGHVSFVDEEDAELAQFRWRANPQGRTVYGQRHNGERSEMLHRAVWKRMRPSDPMPKMIDHIDGDGLNNTRSNLRIATPTQNQQNQRLLTSNISGYKGVNWDLSESKWRARIRIAGRRRSLGRFINPIDAAKAYDITAREVHGVFACLNFPLPGERGCDDASEVLVQSRRSWRGERQSVTTNPKVEAYENALAIVRDHGGELVTVPTETDWAPGDYVEQGEWTGFLVVSISETGEAVLFR